MISAKDKKILIDALKGIDVKRIEADLERVDFSKIDPIKVFRYGAYTGLQMSSEVVKLMPEPKTRSKKVIDGHEQVK
jgi:hypothetical protein